MAAVTEGTGANVADSSLMNMEFVQFTTASGTDYYDCKKLREVETAFACQSTADAVEIQCTWDNTATPPRVTLNLSDGAANSTTGYLIVIGRM